MEIDKWRTQCKYLQEEIEFLKLQLQDAKTIIQLNKEQLRVCYDPSLFDQNNSNKAAVVLLKCVMQENEHLLQKIDKLCIERNREFDKAFISEQINESSQKQDSMIIQELTESVSNLKKQLQLQYMEQNEKQGVIYIDKLIASPDKAVQQLNLKVEQMNQMLLKYRIQIDDLVEQKNELALLNFNLSNEILKIRTQRFTPKGNPKVFFSGNEDPNHFINNLVHLQKKLFFDDESLEEKQDLHKSGVFSPIFTPKLPTKVKRSKGQPSEANADRFVPKLNLAKAQQIQQYNIKRIQLMQARIQGDSLESRIHMIQEELFKTRNKYHIQLVLNQQFDLAFTEQTLKINDLEATNNILVQSNKNYEEKWANWFQQFQFYKDFYLNYKDQTPQKLAGQSEDYSLFELDKVIQSSKRNSSKSIMSRQIVQPNTGASIVKVFDDYNPHQNFNVPTDRAEDLQEDQTVQYKLFILNMAKQVLQIDIDSNKLPRRNDGNRVRIKRSYSNTIEYNL